MNVKTTSDQPHRRTARTPYTSVTLKVSSDRAGNEIQRNKELTVLSLLVRAMNPKRDLDRLNELLRKELKENPVGGGDEEQ